MKHVNISSAMDDVQLKFILIKYIMFYISLNGGGRGDG
jgi:hypothetical protein